MELEKRNIPNVVVKESPRNRYFDRLLETYKSKWVVDLHDPARGYDPSNFSDKNLALLASTKGFDTDLRTYFRDYGYNIGTYGSRGVHPRLLAVELSPWFPKHVTIDFLSSLFQFLQSHDPTRNRR